MGEHDRRLADAVGAIYEAAPVPTRWPQALEAIAAVFGDAGANLFYIRDDGSFGIVVTPSMVAIQREYDKGWWRQDLPTKRAVEYGYVDGMDAKTDRHVVSDAEIENHPYYRDFLRPHGFGWFAGVPVSPEPGKTLAITVHRSAALKPPFTDEELSLLTWVGRHAENALRLSARLLAAEMTSLAFGEALARLDVGVLMVTSSARVIVANPAAESLLGDVLVLSDGPLAARFDPERGVLRATIAAISAAGRNTPAAPARPVVLHGVGRDSYAVAYVLPFQADRGHPFDKVLVDAHAIVVVRKAGRADPLDPSLVRDILNVTLGEARVAALVGAGLQPKEAAARLGITEETARTVLKRVFAKTGVSRQSDLAALLTRLVLPAG